MQFLNNISKEDFLNEYWEKKPLIIKNAIDNPEQLISIEDILEMAENEYFETRRISKNENEWEVEHGPFSKEEFSDKKQDWTLICHNLDLYSEEVKTLSEKVNFIPRWLFDDVMATYSTQDSSVGAHIDNYNVFILQAKGQRQWQIEHKPNKEFEEGLEVKILKEFNPDETFILNPGDMIYIPPHVAHHGVSLTESLSMSIGFKSLEDKKLMDQFCLTTLNNFESESFLKTSFKNSCENQPYHVPQEIVDELFSRMTKELNNKENFENWLVSFLSNSKDLNSQKDSFDEEDSPEELDFSNALEDNEIEFYKDEFLRLAIFEKQKEGKCLISINENLWEISPEDINLFEKLANQMATKELNKDLLKKYPEIFSTLFFKSLIFIDSDE